MHKTRFKHNIKMDVLNFKNNQNDETTILKGLRPVILMGRVLGVIASNDLLSNVSEGKLSRTKRISNLLQRAYSLTLGVYFFIGVILRLKVSADKYGSYLTICQRMNLLITVGAAGFSNFLAYLYLIPKVPNLRMLVQRLEDLSKEIKSEEKTNKSRFRSYPTFCLVLMAIIMFVGTAENFMYQAKGLKETMAQIGALSINSKVLKTFYYDRFTFLGDFVPPYHPIASVIIFLACNMYGLLSWIYVDVLVIVLCRSLTVLLRKFNVSVQPRYVTTNEPKFGRNGNESMTNLQEVWWESIRSRYMALLNLTEDMSRFLSPLFMICYGMNVYYIINNLFTWISPNHASALSDDHFYNYFAFSCFVLRVFSVTYFGAEVYHTGNSIVRTLQHLPDSVYTFSVERLERTMMSSPCGIYLFDTALLSRGFFVSLIGFIFSVEIMMLQAGSGK